VTRTLPHPFFGPWAQARRSTLGLLVLLAALMGGCATVDRAPADPWPALREARPASVLVLPPVNNTPDVEAPGSVMAQAVYPLAEAGYYVLPVGLVNETLRSNGVQTPADAQQVPVQRLREVFGADAALYLEVRKFGSVYRVISSDSEVAVDARLVDLRDGRVLWTGSASASSAEQRGQQQGGIIGALLQAVIEQVASNFSDRNHQVAGIAMRRLLNPQGPRGLLPGPRAVATTAAGR
jgi:hypothetical protein